MGRGLGGDESSRAILAADAVAAHNAAAGDGGREKA